MVKSDLSSVNTIYQSAFKTDYDKTDDFTSAIASIDFLNSVKLSDAQDVGGFVISAICDDDALRSGQFFKYGQVTRTGSAVYISELAVDPNHQGDNYGADLLETVVSQSTKLGIGRIFAAVVNEPKLRAWYQRQGFTKYGPIILNSSQLSTSYFVRDC